MPIDWSNLPDENDNSSVMDDEPKLADNLKPWVETEKKTNTRNDMDLKSIMEQDTNLANYIPFIGVSALKGLWDTGGFGKATEKTIEGLVSFGQDFVSSATFRAVPPSQELNVPRLNASKLIDDAVKYWNARKPEGPSFPDIGVSVDKKGVHFNKVEHTVGSLTGEMAGMVGATAPIGLAMKAGSLVSGMTKAYPFFKSIITGMVGGALLGEGQLGKTLENMALFGIFEPLAYTIGRVPELPKKITGSDWYQRLTTRERGNVIQELDTQILDSVKNMEDLKQQGASPETLQYVGNMTEASIDNKFHDEAWRKAKEEEFKALADNENPSDTVVPDQFKTAEDAEAFGKQANESNIEELKAKHSDNEAEITQLKEIGDLDSILPLTQQNEMYDKVVEVATGESISNAKEQTKDRGKVNTMGVKSVPDIETRAIKTVSKEIEAEIKARDEYIKKLSEDAGMVKRGDVGFAESTLNKDSEYDYNHRVVEEELKIYEKLAGGVDKKPKKTINRITGQTKIRDIVEVNEKAALRDQIRLEAKAAREAFSAGKKEAAYAAKLRQLELLNNQKERITARKRVNKLIKSLKRDIPNSVDVRYKRAIELLTNDIDPGFRTKKTLYSRERTRDFLQRNPDAANDIPRKLLDRLSKKPLNDYSLDDLEAIVNETNKLEKLGKLKRHLKLENKKREIAGVVKSIVSAITKGKGIDEAVKEPVLKSTVKKSRARHVRKAMVASAKDPHRIADRIDNYKDFQGPTYKFFIGKVNDAFDSELKGMDARRGVVHSVMKKAGIKLSDIVKEREIDGVKYSLDEMLDIYAGSLNKRKSLAIEFGNNITKETSEKVIAALSDKEKGFADKIIAEYKDHYDKLWNEVADVENRDMGIEENYTPMNRTDMDYKMPTDEIIAELLHREHLRKAYAAKGNTILRVDIPEEYQKPIKLGLYENWLSTMPKQEHYVNFAQLIKDMHRVLESNDISTAAKQGKGALGIEYIDVLKNYTDKVANPNIYNGLKVWEKVSRELRNNVALYYLAGNVGTVLNQLPAVMMYLPDAGVVPMSSALAEVIKNPMKVSRFINENDPQVKNRQMEKDFDELRRLNTDWYHKTKTAIADVGLYGIYMTDKLSILIGWKAVYNANVGKLGHEGAVKLARDVTLRTQQQSHPKDLPEMYMTNEGLNWLLQFTSQLNKEFNMMVHDVPGMIKNTKYMKAFMTTSAISMGALLTWAIQHRRLPENESDITDSLTDAAIDRIPIVGKSIQQSRKGYSAGEIPPFKAVGQVIRGANKQDMSDVLQGLGLLSGIPGIFIQRSAHFLQSGDPEALLPNIPKQ